VNDTMTVSIITENTVSAASGNPVVCINEDIGTVTFTTTGATGIGSVTGLPAGVSASWFGNTITVSGIPTESGTFTYTIPLTGGCGTLEATGTITVNALPVITLTPQDPSTCNGTDGSIEVNGVGTGTVTWSGPTSSSAGGRPCHIQ
jgi:hypothetical protein